MCSGEERSYKKVCMYNTWHCSRLEISGVFKLNRLTGATEVPGIAMLLLEENKGHMQLKING